MLMCGYMNIVWYQFTTIIVLIYVPQRIYTGIIHI